MPEINLTELSRQLKADKPSKVYLIYGGEDYLKRRALHDLLRVCVPAVLPEFNYERIDGERGETGKIVDATGQMPMMADRRCVLVDNLAVSGDDSQIADCIERLQPGCVLILYYSFSDALMNSAGFRKIRDACVKFGSVLKLDAPTRNETIDIISEEAAGMNAAIKPGDAAYLMDWHGADLAGLIGELQKLAAYAGKRAISREMIEELCPRSLESNAFHIAQSILRGNADEAFRLALNILAQEDPKQDAVSVCACIAGNFVDLYRAKAAVSSGISAEEMIAAFPSDYGGARGFKIRNAMRDCARFPISLLKRYIDLIFDADVRLKSARGDKKIHLEQLISRLCLAKE